MALTTHTFLLVGLFFAGLSVTCARTNTRSSQSRSVGGNTVSSSALSSIASTLWDSDVNAADMNYDYKLNFQGKATKTGNYNYKSLISEISEQKLFNRPTYLSFIKLLNNYNPNTGVAEVMTPTERAETITFINEVMKTDVMQKAFAFLVKYKYAANNVAAFKQSLYNMWFGFYSRKHGVQDSSGFEHVFVGEVKNGEVVGLHNWIQYYLLQKSKKLQYKGYILNRFPNLMKISFKINNWWKKAAGMFHGTSPEFELAIYTICFLTRMEKACEFKINGGFVRIVTYKIGYLKSNVIATAYPAI